MKRGMIMSNHTIRKKSSHFDVKVKLRLTALEKLCGEDINILDCYHGNGDIYKKVEQSVKFDITGIEINDSLSPFKCIKGDNIKIITTLNLNEFNFIDLDSYTDCTELIEYVNKNAKSGTVVVYTMCINRMAGMPKRLIMDEKDISKKIKTITNKFINEKWAAFLYNNGVERFYEINFSDNCFLKKYGYFVVK